MDTAQIANFLAAKKLNSLDRADRNMVDSYFSDEEKVIYEHNWIHLLVYNSFDKQIFYADNEVMTTILLVNNETVTFFAPKIKDISGFGKLLTELVNGSGRRIVFQSVTEVWLKKYASLSSFIDFVIVPRSLNEVIYSTEKLVKLEGKEFSKLRLTRNTVFKNESFSVKPLDESRVNDALSVLEIWQRVQGIKYEKNKYDKEKFVLEKVSGLRGEETNILADVVYYDMKPVGYILLVKSIINKEMATIYLLKGLNRPAEGGVHGITDAIYLYAFDYLHANNILLANDGDLGTEQGTAKHKLRFAPIDRYKYFDLQVI